MRNALFICRLKQKFSKYSIPSVWLHCKKILAIFASPAGMSLTKLSLAGNNLIISGQEEFGYIQAGDGKIANLFYSVLSAKQFNLSL